jgi:hypothetical protein
MGPKKTPKLTQADTKALDPGVPRASASQLEDSLRASTSSDMDDGAFEDSPDDERKRKVRPVANASDEDLLVFVKGADVDISTEARRNQAQLTREIEEEIGEIEAIRLRRDYLRIQCSTALQRDKLLRKDNLLGHAITASASWTQEEKATRHAEENAEKGITWNKVVVTGVSSDWSDDAIRSKTGAAYVRRLRRKEGDHLEDTTSVVIGFVGEPPATVKLGFISFRTRPFIPRPVQCHKCLRFGHVKGKCRSATRCPRCGEGHEFDACPKKQMPEQSHCVNCGQQHSSAYRGCPKYKEVEAVLVTAAVERKSFAEVVKQRQQQQQQTMSIIGPVVQPTQIQSDRLDQRQIEVSKLAAIQTTIIAEHDKKLEQLIEVSRSIAAQDKKLEQLAEQITRLTASQTVMAADRDNKLEATRAAITKDQQQKHQQLGDKMTQQLSQMTENMAQLVRDETKNLRSTIIKDILASMKNSLDKLEKRVTEVARAMDINLQKLDSRIEPLEKEHRKREEDFANFDGIRTMRTLMQ